ncbi:MAG: radical SAM protein [Bacillota bacterium]
MRASWGSGTTQVNCLPLPDFTDLPLEKYLTPETILPLYPSRGCYWGKCAFCSVHELNPVFLERDADQVAQDMIALNKRFGAHHFYMSCDVLSPRSMLSLAKTLSEKAPGLKWQSEARFEKALTVDSIRQLADGGCDLLRFGLESGSESVLRDMRKGTDLETVRTILGACKENNIRTAVYCIVGFPTESEKDLGRTVEFLKDMRSAIDYVGFHQFILNSGSEVSLRPSDFGVEPAGSLNQVTSEKNYRATRGMSPSVLKGVFERVKNEIGELICTEIPVGPAPVVTCISQVETCGRKGATARHLMKRPIPELDVSIGDVLCVDGLTGDITVERKQ